MTSEEKFESVHTQCKTMWELNIPIDLHCPYCYRVTKANSDSGPCCRLMDIAIRAIIERAQAVDEAMKCYERREFGRMIMGDKHYN